MPRKPDKGPLDELLQPTPEAFDTPQPTRPGKPGRLKKRGTLPVRFVRIPVSWFTKQRRGKWLLPADMRLFCWLIEKTGEGQRPWRVTGETGAEVGIPARTRRRVLARLEECGAIRIERTNHNAPQVSVVWVFG
jgi:hypothetical protein